MPGIQVSNLLEAARLYYTALLQEGELGENTTRLKNEMLMQANQISDRLGENDPHRMDGINERRRKQREEREQSGR